MSAVPLLSRARLKKDAPIAALARTLVPDDADARVATAHKLVWTLFADTPERERDFLWRESGPGEFYILSRRPPVDPHGLFDIDPPKEFAPNLEAGQQLHFLLRANATVSKPMDTFRTAHRSADLKPRRKSARHDVVMNAIRNMEGPERAKARQDAVQSAGAAWLMRKLLASGAQTQESAIRVEGYRVLRPPRTRAEKEMHIGVLDFQGMLSVTDPVAFLRAQSEGFGRAKAFGCGLMLVRRA